MPEVFPFLTPLLIHALCPLSITILFALTCSRISDTRARKQGEAKIRRVFRHTTVLTIAHILQWKFDITKLYIT